MQSPTLALRAHIDKSFAAKVMARFHDNAPNVRKVFHSSIKEKVSKDRLLISPQGRQRFFFGRMDDTLYREAFAFIPQSTITDQTKSIMLHISEGFAKKNLSADFIYENHDGVMAEQRIEEAELFFDLFKEASERTIDFRKCSIPRDIDLSVPAELDYSLTNAKDMKPYKGNLL
jgi:DNA polymerase I-like protein with 3'-5' exonuclease and polymerase domains